MIVQSASHRSLLNRKRTLGVGRRGGEVGGGPGRRTGGKVKRNPYGRLLPIHGHGRGLLRDDG